MTNDSWKVLNIFKKSTSRSSISFVLRTYQAPFPRNRDIFYEVLCHLLTWKSSMISKHVWKFVKKVLIDMAYPREVPSTVKQRPFFWPDCCFLEFWCKRRTLFQVLVQGLNVCQSNLYDLLYEVKSKLQTLEDILAHELIKKYERVNMIGCFYFCMTCDVKGNYVGQRLKAFLQEMLHKNVMCTLRMRRWMAPQ